MRPLSGVISDRLRKLLGANDPAWGGKRQGEAPPSPSSIRSAQGRGLGKGATRKRSGEGAK